MLPVPITLQSLHSCELQQMGCLVAGARQLIDLWTTIKITIGGCLELSPFGSYHSSYGRQFLVLR